MELHLTQIMEEPMKKILCLFLILSASSAQAGFLIEPYLGYSIGSGENSASVKTEYDQNSPFLGARLGYQTLGLMFGIDYTMGSESDFETKSGTTTFKQDADQSTFGLFVGYNLPVMLRAWAAYYMSTSIEIQSGASIGDEYNGSGYGLGVGFTGLPFVSLNLEYRMMTFDEFKDNSSGLKSTLSGNSEIDYNQVMLSVSLPLDI